MDENRSLGWLLLGALAIRLPFVAVDPGRIADPQILADWAESLARGGPSELIASTGAMVLYPPLSTLALWASGVLGALVGSPFAAPEAATLGLIKAMAVAADVALTWLMVRLLRGRAASVRIAAAAAIAVNPALWYLSAIWGQIDSVFVLLMICSVGALSRHRTGLSWAYLAAAAAWKLQALPLVPLVAGRSARVGGLRGLLSGLVVVASTTVLLMALLLPVAEWPAYASRLWQPHAPPYITAFNAWYLVVPLTDSLTGSLAAIASYALAPIAILSFAAVAIVVAAVAWAQPRTSRMALAAVILTLAAFVLLPGMRERYMIGALPFAVLLAAGWESGRVDRAWVAAAAALTASQTVNLVAVASFAPELWTNVFAGGGSGPLAAGVAALGYLAAGVNVAVLAWALWRLIAGMRERPPVTGRALPVERLQ